MADRIEFAKGVYGYDVPESGVKVTVKSGEKKGKQPSALPPFGNNTETAETRAETALAELRNNYAKQLRSEYDYSVDKMKKERDEALRENWILQQQEEAGLSEKLAAEGINGGAAETTLSELKSRYQGNRNDIRKGYLEELGDFSSEHQNKLAEAARGYDEKWLEYLITLAENEDEFEKDLVLKKY